PKWTGYQLLALIFGTLLSSQGTDASFVLTLAGFPPGFVLRVSDSIRLFRVRFPVETGSCFSLSSSSLSRFPFRRFRLYQKFSTGFPGVHILKRSWLCPMHGN
ncbi:hypothetical protein ACIQWR_41420, partial [Streptomyces sp. NPDC098789]|uniref:hypothetical protein n=1 Tax=Streptomyces sp. NPDC098789 TaxID=3366098 RepID=UPI003812C59D